MLLKEKDILIISSSIKQKDPIQKILIIHKNNLLISNLETNENNNITINSKDTSSLSFPDDILSIHHLTLLNKILVSCVSNKNLYLIEENIIYDTKKISEFNIENDSFIFQGNKKMTSIIDVEESKDKYFLLISDKFGEISIKPITNKETKESFSKEIKIVSGHCDTINFFKQSKDKKLLLSSDNFGKIKVYNFPNIFNVLSVILYHEDEIKYVDFGGEFDKCIIVLNKEKTIDVWSTYDFVIQKKIKLYFLEDEENMLSVKMINKNNNLVLITNKKIVILEIDDIAYNVKTVKEILLTELIEEEKIEKCDFKFFDYKGKVFNLIINLDNHEIIKISSIFNF